MMGAVSRIQQCLCFRPHVGAVKQQLTDVLAQGCAAWLARGHHFEAGGGQLVGEDLNLGGFPSAVPAFKADKHYSLAFFVLDVFFAPVVFLALDVFFAVAFFRVVFLRGAALRRNSRSSQARSLVSVLGSSFVRSEAFTSPSVTYKPKRPSFKSTGLPETGSVPNSLRGGCAWRRIRVHGWARRACASSKVMVKICSWLSKVRLSLPPLEIYGP